MSLPSCKPSLADRLLPNRPDALCDKPINLVASQPNNSDFIFIFNVSFFASLLYIAHLFARHQVALLCAVSNICCHARPCPRAYFCQHRISIPRVPRSMGRFLISLCRHKVKQLLLSKPTLDIENLVKRKYRNP